MLSVVFSMPRLQVLETLAWLGRSSLRSLRALGAHRTLTPIRHWCDFQWWRRLPLNAIECSKFRPRRISCPTLIRPSWYQRHLNLHPEKALEISKRSPPWEDPRDTKNISTLRRPWLCRKYFHPEKTLEISKISPRWEDNGDIKNISALKRPYNLFKYNKKKQQTRFPGSGWAHCVLMVIKNWINALLGRLQKLEA